MERSEEVEVILVEDNPNDIELTLRELRKYNFVNKVHVLKDGGEALEYIFDTAFSGKDVNDKEKVILLDLRLPKVDGLEVLQKIKSNEQTKVIPVIVMTSSTEERDIVESYELGVNSYIVKPVDFNKFVKAVSEIGLYWRLLNQPSVEVEEQRAH